MANDEVNPKVKEEYKNIIDTFNFFKGLVYLAEFYPNEESKSLLFNKLYELEHILQQNYVDIIKGVKKEIYKSVYYNKTICSLCKHDLEIHNHEFNRCDIEDCNCVYGYDQVLNIFHDTVRVDKEIKKNEL